MKVRDILRRLLDDGWYLVCVRGSHRQYKHARKQGRDKVALGVKALHELLGLKPDHLPSLQALARASDDSAARYIGLVGSKRKVFRLLQRVAARQGLADLARVYAPVGLDLGAVTPEEIAVSIIGELLALRHGRVANHMRATGEERLELLLDADDGGSTQLRSSQSST